MIPIVSFASGLPFRNNFLCQHIFSTPNVGNSVENVQNCASFQPFFGIFHDSMTEQLSFYGKQSIPTGTESSVENQKKCGKLRDFLDVSCPKSCSFPHFSAVSSRLLWELSTRRGYRSSIVHCSSFPQFMVNWWFWNLPAAYPETQKRDSPLGLSLWIVLALTYLPSPSPDKYFRHWWA